MFNLQKRLFVVLIFLLLALQTYSQAAQNQKIKFYTDYPIFHEMPSVEKYEGHSAVILARLVYYEILKPANKSIIYSKSISRNRIKLLDKNAVEEYSTFSFSDELSDKRGFYKRNKVKFYAAYNIIKPNGDVIVVDLSKAIEDNTEVAASRVKGKKIAIENLQVGDIVDYSIGYELPYDKSNVMLFEEEFVYLKRKYPVVNAHIQINLGNDCYISAKSMNGAGDLIFEGVRIGRKTYSLSYSDVDKYKSEIWMDRSDAVPYLKYQVSFIKIPPGSIGNTYKKIFTSKSLQIKTKLSYPEYLDLGKYITPAETPYTPPYATKACIRYLKGLGYEKGSGGEALRIAYYFLKHHTFNNRYYAMMNQNVYYYGSFWHFYSAYSLFLSNWGISSRVFIASDNEAEIPESVLFPDEFSYGVYIPSEEKFVTDFSLLGHYENVQPYLQGQEAAIYDMKAKRFNQKIQIPVQDVSLNTNEEKHIFNLDVENESFNVNSSLILRANLIQAELDFFDNKKYDDEINTHPTFKNRLMSWINRNEKIRNNIKADIEEDQQAMIESISDKLENLYGEKIDPQNCSLEHYGTFDIKKGCSIRYTFDIKQALIKTGDEVIFNLENVFRNFISENDFEDERQSGIDFGYLSKKKIIAEIHIPSGYTVAECSAEEMSKDFGFANVSFKLLNSSENIIAFELVKEIKEINVDKDQWEKVKDLYNFMEEISNTGIIIKKK